MFNDYDPRWQEAFEQEQQLLHEVLGEFIASVNHVGSTAVPGLSARPIIDLAVESAVFPPGRVIEAALKTLAYLPVNEEDAVDCCHFMKGRKQGFCLYWHPVGGTRFGQQLRFRDRLRNDPHVAGRYNAVKRALAEEHRYDEREYQRHKAAVIEAILKQMEDESTGTRKNSIVSEVESGDK